MSVPAHASKWLQRRFQPLRTEILDGLNASPRRLPSKLFYDPRGAELFDAITRTKAYYPTRAEIEILHEHSQDFTRWAGRHAHVIEFGSGSGIKTQILLDALDDPAMYTPIDVSKKQLMEYAASLRIQRPALKVTPLSVDYTHDFEIPHARQFGRVIAFFPGSTIGNFEPEDALEFLKRVRRICGNNGGLLIGVDIRKDLQTIEYAYNDPEGITAEFNLNILRHVNAVIGAQFDTALFEHLAFFNDARSRIEMHLIAKTDHLVPVAGAPAIALRKGEAIITEYSYKYSVDAFQQMAERAGFTGDRTFLDSRGLFSVHLLDA